MFIIRKFFVFSLLLFLVISINPQTKIEANTNILVNPTKVNEVFKDKAISDKIVANLKLTNGDSLVSQSQLDTIKNLQLGNLNISDISGLEYLSNLDVLVVKDNQDLVSIEPLRSLSEITQIDISNTNVNDISPLVNNKGIEHLYLSNTKIKDLSVIENFASTLRYLYLENLDLNDNDALPINNATELVTITVNGNNITNLTFLSNSTDKLYKVFAADNKIGDIETLNSLKVLGNLNLDNNLIKDISSLSNNSTLLYLHLKNNLIEEVNLINADRLLEVDLSYNKINNININTTSVLRYLYLENNELSDILQLNNLILNNSIISLNLENNKLDKLNGLALNTSLNAISFNGNKLKDINGIEKLTNLTSLTLSNNEISNINPIRTLIKLTYLNLNNNHINDISPIVPLTSLKNIYLENQIINNEVRYQENLSIVNSIVGFKELTFASESNKSNVSNLGFSNSGSIENNNLTWPLPTYVPQVSASFTNSFKMSKVVGSIKYSGIINYNLIEPHNAIFQIDNEVINTQIHYREDLLSNEIIPQKEGYSINGWYSEDKLWDFKLDKMPDKDLVLNAKYDLNQYQLTYDNDGILTTSLINYNEFLTIPSLPEKIGYTFNGWYLEDVLWDYNNDKMPSNDITLKAKYSINKYTLSIDYNEDNDITNNIEYTLDYNTNFDLTKINIPKRFGYHFNGYSLQGKLIDTINITSDIELKASWYDLIDNGEWSINTNDVIYEKEEFIKLVKENKLSNDLYTKANISGYDKYHESELTPLMINLPEININNIKEEYEIEVVYQEAKLGYNYENYKKLFKLTIKDDSININNDINTNNNIDMITKTGNDYLLYGLIFSILGILTISIIKKKTT